MELSKRLKAGDWIAMAEVCVNVEVLAAGTLDLPMGILGACSFGGDAAGNGSVNREECSIECALSVR